MNVYFNPNNYNMNNYNNYVSEEQIAAQFQFSEFYKRQIFKKKNNLIILDKVSFSKTVEKLIENQYRLPEKISDSFINILMIAEKPSIARIITKFLSDNNYIQIKFDKYNETKYFLFKGVFKGVEAEIYVSYVYGHIYESNFTNEDKQRNFEYVNLFDVSTQKFYKEKDINTPLGLSFLGKGIDILCLWLDCDIEGENICYQTILNVVPYMNKKSYRQVYRAKFSSLTELSIKKAYNGISEFPNLKFSECSDARRIIDLKLGCIVTKFLTEKILKPLSEVSSTFKDLFILSYGPCQTPALSLCAERHEEIKNFKNEKCYVLRITYSINKKEFIFEGQSKFKTVDIANKKLKSINKCNAFIKEIKDEKITKKPPNCGLNSIELLSLASRYLKLSSYFTMQIAEKLYMKGYISYPRTETTKYDKEYEYDNIIKSLIENLKINDKNNLIQHVCPDGGIDRSDHPPITPLKIMRNNEELSSDESLLFNFITNYFLASFCIKNLEYIKKQITIDINGELFHLTSEKIIQKGYMSIFKYEENDFLNLSIEEFEVNEKINYEGLKICETFTKTPPNIMTEYELIKLMEKHSIGTDGSIPNHINNLCSRRYITINDDTREIKITKIGLTLIQGLRSINQELVSHSIRKNIEEDVSKIAIGKMNYEDVLDSSIKRYKELFTELYSNEEMLLIKFKEIINQSK